MSSFSLKDSKVTVFKAQVISLFNPLCNAKTILLLFCSANNNSRTSKIKTLDKLILNEYVLETFDQQGKIS